MGMDPFKALAFLRMVGGHSHTVWFGVVPCCKEEGFSLSVIGAGGWVDRLSPFGSGASMGLLVWDKSPCVGQVSSCETSLLVRDIRMII